MRPLFKLCLVSLAPVLLLSSAHADTQTLSFSAVLDEHAIITGGISGTLTLNDATGQITGADFRAGTNRGGYDFSNAPTSQTISDGLTELSFTSDKSDAEFNLDLPVTDLNQLSLTAICSLQAPCTGNVISSFSTGDDDTYVQFGSIHGPSTPVNPTPEPSALLLIGTGLSGAAVALRRRGTR